MEKVQAFAVVICVEVLTFVAVDDQSVGAGPFDVAEVLLAKLSNKVLALPTTTLARKTGGGRRRPPYDT